MADNNLVEVRNLTSRTIVLRCASGKTIRSFFIDAEIVCGLKKPHAKILAGSKSFDRMLFVAKERGLRGTLRQASRLRGEGFDVAVLVLAELGMGPAHDACGHGVGPSRR